MEEITAWHLSVIKAPRESVALKDPRPCAAVILASVRSVLPAARLAGAVLTAFAATVRGSTVCLGDVCLYEHNGVRGVGHVWFHVSVDGILYTCLAPWERTQDGGNYWKCRVHGSAGFAPTSALLTSCIYSAGLVGGVATVLIPYEWR